MIKKTLKIFGMEECNGIKTPLETNCHLESNGDIINVPFRELIGSLMFIALGTRPDITHAVSLLSQFLDCRKTSIALPERNHEHESHVYKGTDIRYCYFRNRCLLRF